MVDGSKIALVHLLGSLVAKRTVRSALVVVKPPGFDEQLGISQTREPVGMETLIPKLAVEAFDELQLDTVVVCPLIQHLARQRDAVVEHNGRRSGAVMNEVVKHAHDARGW